MIAIVGTFFQTKEQATVHARKKELLTSRSFEVMPLPHGFIVVDSSQVSTHNLPPSLYERNTH